MTNIELNTVRQLTEKFFNATISENEAERLSGYAEVLAGDNPSFKVSDSKLLNDLTLIRALNCHAEACLKSISAETPRELETKLDEHISRLAGASRKRVVFKRLISFSSAAAVIAAVATFGLRYIGNGRSESEISSGYASVQSHFCIPEAIAPQSENTAAHTTIPEVQKHAALTSARVSHTATIHPVIPSRPSEQSVTTPMGPIHEKIRIPDLSDPMIDVMPMIAAASIDPANIVIQPLSTISQTVCNVYESVDAVSASFAGIAETLDLVNSSLALVSTTSLDL